MADTKLSAETLVSAIAAAYKIYVVTDTGTAPDSNAATFTQVKDFLRNAFGTLNDTGASLVEAAIQSEMETASSTTLAVTPGRQHFHPSAAKQWANWNTSGTLAASYNTTSITDNSTGNWTVVIATDFSSLNYAAVAMGGTDVGTAFPAYNTRDYAAGSYVVVSGSGPTPLDPDDDTTIVSVAFGDI